MWLEPTLAESFNSNEGANFGTSNTDVTNWINIADKDRVGNFNITQTTPANKPHYLITGINGLPALEFGISSNRMLSSDTFTITNPFTLFMVLAFDRTSGSKMTVFDTVVSGSNKRLFLSSSGGVAGQLDVGLGNTNPNITGTYDTNPHIYALRSGGGTSGVNSELYIDGLSVDSSSAASIVEDSGVLSIGSSLSNNNFYDGKIGEIIFYDRSLNAEEIDLIETYLSDKWSITIN
jgi:hypothetical protein